MPRKDLLSCLCSFYCFCSVLIYASCAVHDELSQCELQGVYRQRQSLIESPNYPDNYPPNTCVDFVIRSPYRCPTKFHIQFLDFQLELSENCSRDYLAIGLQQSDDDMDVLCGQVLGIKKYHTPDGILRLRFLSDDSPWTTAGGFRLLITRLACENEDLTARGLDMDVDEDDTVQVNAKLPPKKALHPHHHQQPQQQSTPAPLPGNFSLSPQQAPFVGFPAAYPGYQPINAYPYPGVAYPPYLPARGGSFYLPAAQPAGTLAPPCSNEPQKQQQQQQFQQQLLQQQQLQLQQQQQQQSLQQLQQQLQQQQPQAQVQSQHQQQELPAIAEQYQSSSFQPQGVQLKDYDPQTLQQFGGSVDLCCVSSFTQSHFYLSSPGFPRTVLNALLPGQQRDCVFYLEKNSQNVAGLRILFKFFDFGQPSGGGIYPGQAGAACSGDFIELDGQRYCGCRSGHVHKSFWPEGRKALRLRMGQSGGGTSNGFLLEIFQDQDTESYRPGLQGLPGLAGSTGAGAGALGVNRITGLQGTTGLAGLPGSTGLAGLPGSTGLAGFTGSTGFTGLPGANGFTGLPGTTGLPTGIPLPAGYQPQLGAYQPQLGYQPQLAQQPLYHPQAQAPLWSFNPLLPITPYRQSRQAAWTYARGLDAQQPSRVVETNSTRKEFYYFDADEAFARAALDAAEEVEDNVRATPATTSSTSASVHGVQHKQPVTTKAFEQSSCTFDYMEVLRLSVDTLWLTKPICLAPLRSWFSNIFG
ncbi:histone-lysine N-methyltransferase 2D [Drosophila sulfurigaster albostrigata]|uniref:histone-lysine N-methyltransferase 2D n=1 Tax=Drosophila sulfurigaster albostrigata TaxID=89887 RepID=UPI002D21ADB4|nr:histone-lysine N-methyltransferase 2D [Drosophila sulfurigaster albostrigata]